ncbi:MAG: hypothetical protein WD512_11160 [Candidatus Paceibacterota bacterium]
MSIQKFPGATCYYDGKNPSCTCPSGSEKQLLRANEMGPGNPSQDQYWCNFVSSNCTDKLCSCLTHNTNRNCLCPAGSKKVYVPIGTIPGFSRDYFYCCDQAGKPVGTGGRYPEICTAASTRASLASSTPATGSASGTSTTMLDSPGVKVIGVSGTVSGSVSTTATGTTNAGAGITTATTGATTGTTTGTATGTSTGSGVGTGATTGTGTSSAGNGTGSGVGTTGTAVGTTDTGVGTGGESEVVGSGEFYPTGSRDTGDMILWYVFGMGLPILLLVIFIIVVFLSKKSSE